MVRSALQIRSDVERQGDFIRFLIKEVEGAAFANIQDVVTFVKWLDNELSRLVRSGIQYVCMYSVCTTHERRTGTNLLHRSLLVTTVCGYVMGACVQVDERAVLKHFEWPEQKADALREAAFGYCDLKKLEVEASSFRDDARQPCAAELKKMQALFEK